MLITDPNVASTKIIKPLNELIAKNTKPKEESKVHPKRSTLDYLQHDEKPRQTYLQKHQHTPDKCYTLIHGQWYDLTEFRKIHPGGEAALSLASGRDSTALFESHHVFSSKKLVDHYLKKYRMSKEDSQHLETLESASFIGDKSNDDPFDWPENGSEFRNDLISRVREYFEKEAKRRGIKLNEAIKATPYRWFQMSFLFTIFLGSVYLSCFGHPIMILVLPITAWVFSVNSFHNANHFSISSNPKINSFIGYLSPSISSPFTWYHQHVIGHHVYTNIPYRDPDLVHSPDTRREHVAHPWDIPHETQDDLIRLSAHFLLGLWLGMGLVNDLKLLYSKSDSYNGFVPRIPSTTFRLFCHFLGRILYMLVVFAWPFFVLTESSFLIKLGFSVIPIMVHSALFMVNTQINHIAENAMKKTSRDFYKHQILTSQNFGNSFFHFILSGGLNFQTEHHLFPNVNHIHYASIQPIVKEVCKKHRVPYNHVSGYVEALKNYYSYSKSVGACPQGTDRKCLEHITGWQRAMFFLQVTDYINADSKEE